MDSPHEETLGEEEGEQQKSAKGKLNQVSNKIDEEEEESSTLKEKPGWGKGSKNPTSGQHDAEELNHLY